MRIIGRESYRRMPWKNGQGLTEEVACYPRGSDTEMFGWRLSMAHVSADGPFSAFPDIDRSIILLEGEGLNLDLPDGRTVELRLGSPAFSFPGEWAVSSRNVDGPTLDLNIMTRRCRYAHEIRLVSFEIRHLITPQYTTWLVATSPVRIEQGSEGADLSRFDAVHLDREPDAELVAPAGDSGSRAASVIVVTLRQTENSDA